MKSKYPQNTPKELKTMSSKEKELFLEEFQPQLDQLKSCEKEHGFL